MKSISSCLLTCLVTMITLTALDFLWAWLFMLLWNWLIPAIFHGPTVSYWEAFGIVLLLSFIGGFFKATVSSKGE